MTKAVPSISVPVLDRFRRWNPIWYTWVKPLLQSVKASANGVIEVTETVDAAKGQWGIEVNVNNRVTAAIKLDGSDDESSFAVMADRFEIINPADNGDELTAFIVGNVAGTPTVGVDGDVIVDDTIAARHIDVDELSAVAVDVGEMTAGVAQSANGATVIDLDNEIIQITTSTRRLRYEGGAVAVYDVPSATSTDNAPLTDPDNNISRLHFHSDLPSPSIIKTAGTFIRTGSISLPSQSQNNFNATTHVLFSHGRSGTPLVFGRVLIDGTTLAALNGSLPLNLGGNVATFTPFVSRWAHLGATASQVRLRVHSMTTNTGSLAAMTLDWEVYVTDVLLDGTPDAPSDTVALRMNAAMMTAGHGAFDSRKRYIRIANSGALLNMVHGKTADANPTTGGTSIAVSARYNLGSYTRQFGPNAGSHTSTFTPMKF